jgi:hypothetical protein
MTMQQPVSEEMVVKSPFYIKYGKIQQLRFLLILSEVYKLCVRKDTLYNTLTDKILFRYISSSIVQNYNARESCRP